MLIVENNLFSDVAVAHISVNVIDSRAPQVVQTIQSVDIATVKHADTRVAKDYLMAISFDTETLISEDLARYLTLLHIEKRKVLFSVPEAQGRSFATLVPIDSYGRLWATPTWPIYPYTSVLTGNANDFTKCVYVNRLEKTSGFTVDQLNGILTFDPPILPTDEVLMRYQCFIECVVVQAQFEEWAESPDFKTGTLQLQSINDRVVALPAFRETQMCAFEDNLTMDLAFAIGSTETIQIEQTIVTELIFRIDGNAIFESKTTLSIDLVDQVLELKIGDLLTGPVIFDDIYLSDAGFSFGIEAVEDVDIIAGQPAILEIRYDGSRIHQIPLEEIRANEWIDACYEIPASVKAKILDPSLVTVGVIRYDLSRFEIDNLGFFTKKAVQPFSGGFDIGFEAIDIVELPDADILSLSSVLQFAISDSFDLTGTHEGLPTSEDPPDGP